METSRQISCCHRSHDDIQRLHLFNVNIKDRDSQREPIARRKVITNTITNMPKHTGSVAGANVYSCTPRFS
ncbi:hypothetical protein MKW98_015641 [Papaver atlanticum]|uniref:Uncharacterized protein n=1 Tax=Papaver atlanticum TaxID=357466 RepID=A0AAD4S5G8_9MAGN|nr:hypothetical protein MKW98_015641 [Papaver atlanticum]